jgi:pyruvate/2-oxoglutarate dehydrogenase complex dihydrolipoamide acyltransferase (E2) component
MAHSIVMPSFGMYTAEGTLVNWLAADGAEVSAGQPVVEIETEKGVHEVQSPADGVLLRRAEVGELLKVEGLIGYVLAAGEPPPAEARSIVSPEASAAPRAGPSPAAGAPTPRGAMPQAAPAPAGEPGAPLVKASPIARRLALEHSIDLTGLRGSGPGGRIVEADVEAEIRRRAAPD